VHNRVRCANAKMLLIFYLTAINELLRWLVLSVNNLNVIVFAWLIQLPVF